jgi:hypothetical protein
MNERIRELKIQACKWASENASPAEYENAADQKFAELIVLACAARCEMSPYPHANYSVAIKEDFGLQPKG